MILDITRQSNNDSRLGRLSRNASFNGETCIRTLSVERALADNKLSGEARHNIYLGWEVIT